MSFPATQILPRVTISWRSNNRTSVDFPDPEGPTRNTNSPRRMLRETSRAATVPPLYTFVTESSLIKTNSPTAQGRGLPTGQK